MDVVERITAAATTLTPAERRVAEAVIADRQLVAFGTVSELAQRSSAGAATVVRLATKLGYDGYSGLQAAVQQSLRAQLRPAVERLRHVRDSANPQSHLEIEADNVRATLASLDSDVIDEASSRLAHGRAVWIISGDASTGVAQQFAADLSVLREDVRVVSGNAVAVARQLALIEPNDVVVMIDLRRYDGWVLDAAQGTVDRGAWRIALTDRLLSPLALLADRTVVVSAASNGPFDSHVGTLAALNALVVAAAERLRESAAPRLERIEAAWRAAEALREP